METNNLGGPTAAVGLNLFSADPAVLLEYVESLGEIVLADGEPGSLFAIDKVDGFKDESQ
jgi:hypothetical protein